MAGGIPGTSKYEGVKAGSKEYIRLQSADRRLDPEYIKKQKDYQTKNRKKIRARVVKKRSELSPEELKDLRNREKISSKKWKDQNPEKYLFFNARDRAYRRGIEFSIEINDIVIPELCPVFGYKLVGNEGMVKHNSMSLDRIDSAKGYVKGNIIVVSHRANSLKNNASMDELERIVEFYRGIT